MICLVKRKSIFIPLLAGLFLFALPAVHAATLNLSTDKQTFVIGDTFSVDVKVDSGDVGVNAVQATIKYPQDTVAVTSIDQSSSAFTFWLQQPIFSNDTGEITFIGGSLSGLSGKSLEVFKVNFKIKGSGNVALSFTDGAITASDGSGTNVLSSMNGLQLTSITKQDATLIKPPQIVRPAVPTGKIPVVPTVTVSLYPDQTQWYNAVSPFITNWDLPKDVTDVATMLNQEPAFDPTKSEGLFDNKNFGALGDGVWYLHVRFKNAVGWGPTDHYKIAIDTIPPLPFTAEVKEGLSTEKINPTLTFKTSDQPSGISEYRILIDNVVVGQTTDESFVLPPQRPGTYAVIVQAQDKAGNRSESRLALTIQELPFLTIAGLKITQFWFFAIIIIILILGFAVGWIARHFAKKKEIDRVIIAQRDVVVLVDMVKKDIDAMLSYYKDGTLDPREAHEMNFVLERIKERLAKMEEYVVGNIDEIVE